MTLFMSGGRVIELGEPLGGGAEGQIFRLAETPDLCAKIYLDPTPYTGERLSAMMGTTPAHWRGDHAEHMHVAWPREILWDPDGLARGFLMPLVDGAPLTHLFDPRKRLAAVDAPTWRMVVTVAARVARLLAMLHEAGIVMGDLSPTNLVLSSTGHVTLVDCDTVQFTDPKTGEAHRCTKLTPEYAAPELGSGAVAELQHGHDDFGLAILVCQLLTEGEHPFEGVPADPACPDGTAADNIRMQNNRILFPERFTAVADGMPPDFLPPRVLDLARACFGEGHRDPGARPSAADWADALDQVGFQLMGCRRNEHHNYHHTLGACPWCAKCAAGHGDHFPPPGIATVAIPYPVPAQGRQPAWAPPPVSWPPAPQPHWQVERGTPNQSASRLTPAKRFRELPKWAIAVIAVFTVIVTLMIISAILSAL
jgi:DNA-binding helix-hairpin-helix protein with protein kinase domain